MLYTYKLVHLKIFPFQKPYLENFNFLSQIIHITCTFQKDHDANVFTQVKYIADEILFQGETIFSYHKY